MSLVSVPYMHIIAKIFPGKQIMSQAITTFTVNILDEEQQDASSDVFCSIFVGSLSAKVDWPLLYSRN